MGEAIYYVIEFILKCIFVYPFVAVWKLFKFIQERNPPAPPIIPAKTRPATPQETAVAGTQLQLAHRFLVQAYERQDNTDAAMRALSLASEAANKARVADPAARVTVEQDRMQVTYTVDELSGQILYSQGDLFLQGMHLLMNRLHEADSVAAAKENERTMRTYTRGALSAAQAAVAYQPSSIRNRVLLAKALRATSRPKDAKKVIQEVLQMDPHNLDALQVQAELNA